MDLATTGARRESFRYVAYIVATTSTVRWKQSHVLCNLSKSHGSQGHASYVRSYVPDIQGNSAVPLRMQVSAYERRRNSRPLQSLLWKRLLLLKFFLIVSGLPAPSPTLAMVSIPTALSVSGAGS